MPAIMLTLAAVVIATGVLVVSWGQSAGRLGHRGRRRQLGSAAGLLGALLGAFGLFTDSWPTVPVVVARGERLLATRIEALASQAGLPCFPDGPLASELIDVREGAAIPASLYAPVAGIVKVILEGREGAS